MNHFMNWRNSCIYCHELLSRVHDLYKWYYDLFPLWAYKKAKKSLSCIYERISMMVIRKFATIANLLQLQILGLYWKAISTIVWPSTLIIALHNFRLVNKLMTWYQYFVKLSLNEIHWIVFIKQARSSLKIDTPRLAMASFTVHEHRMGSCYYTSWTFHVVKTRKSSGMFLKKFIKFFVHSTVHVH